MHGLGGFKEQDRIRTFAEAFFEEGFTVIRFDTTNTFGESDGNYENATLTNYYEDLEDVIKWAREQKWYQRPFVLAGHSLGGFSTAYFAERHPAEVLAVAPISPVVSGVLNIEADKRYEPENLKRWEKTGWKEEQSRSRPGTIKRLAWHPFKKDILQYDLLPQAANLTMPILLIVGEKDEATPPDQTKQLFNALSGPKELHVIKAAPHTFRDPSHLAKIKKIISDWIVGVVLKTK